MASSKKIDSDKFLKQIIGSSKNAKVLMVNPFITDLRLPWAQWHQPTALLQLSSFLKQQNINVRLVDFIHTTSKQVVRRKHGEIERGGHLIPLWRFGLSSHSDIQHRIKRQLRGKWKPDAVLVTALNSVWWEDAKEVIEASHALLPDTPIYLGGVYPSFEPAHANKNSGANFVVSGRLPDVTKCSLDLSLYLSPPKSAGIYFYHQDSNGNLIPRQKQDILNEIQANIKLGALEFVFFDEEIEKKDIQRFIGLLDSIVEKGIKTRLILLGNISAKSMSKKLAKSMKSAGVRKIFLKCNLNFNDQDYFGDSLEDYQKCMTYLSEDAGYKPGTDDIAAMVVVGAPFEDLRIVSRRIIALSHVVRTVIPVPFQYVPLIHKKYSFHQDPSLNGNNPIERQIKRNLNSPEKLNGKIYPFAEISGYSYEEYLELTRLTALLNSKYRGSTFDFLGDSFTAQRFRESIRTKGWDPFKPKDEIGAVFIDNLLIKSEKL